MPDFVMWTKDMQETKNPSVVWQKPVLQYNIQGLCKEPKIRIGITLEMRIVFYRRRTLFETHRENFISAEVRRIPWNKLLW